MRDPKKTVYINPGITGSISAASGETWTGTIGGSLKTSISDFISSVDATVSGSVSYSKTTTVTVAGSWKNTTSGLKWLALGSIGRSMNWSYGSWQGGCTWKPQASGSASLPALSPVIAHQ